MGNDVDKDRELGYLRALAEGNMRANQELRDELREFKLQNIEDARATREALQSLRDELNMYKTFIRVLKLLGLLSVAILTFKFGDISDIWNKG